MNISRIHWLAFGAALLATHAWASPCDPKACDPKACDPQHRASCQRGSSASVVVAPSAASECVVAHATGGACCTVTSNGHALVVTSPGEQPLVVTGSIAPSIAAPARELVVARGLAPAQSLPRVAVASTTACGDARADRVSSLLERVRAAPAAPAAPAGGAAAEAPALPAIPSTPCPPEHAPVAEPGDADVGFDVPFLERTAETGRVAYERARDALSRAEAELQDDEGVWERHGEELAAAEELAQRARADAAQADARDGEARARSERALERARSAYRRQDAAAKALAELNAARAGQEARTFLRGSSPDAAARSLEERVARLEALANERHPERAQARGGTRSLEERVAELEALLDAPARDVSPRATRSGEGLGGGFKRLQELPRTPLAPGVYSFDSQNGQLRALGPAQAARPRTPAPSAGGGGARGEAPRAFRSFERAAPAEPAPDATRRDEVERRMTELRAQMTRLREQMNAMRAEIEALPR